MTSLRRLSYTAFGVACLHLVFGAVVRISGSGMGCGDHWPRCYGRWFPPLDRPDLIIEVSHRYLASLLLVSLIALLVAAWRRRQEPAVGGPRGVLRAAALAVALGLAAALLGAMTVKLGNAPFATLAHWTVAMSLVAAVVATVIRAGGFGGAVARLGGASARTKRGAFAGAAMALLTVVMGGLTAKYPGAAVACLSFPQCGANPDVLPAAVHVQLTHRVLAVLLVLHLVGLVMGLRRRRETPIVRRAAAVALSLGVLQLLVAGAMIGLKLPPVLRSLHEATGVSIWIATFALAYLARIASGGSAVALAEPAGHPPVPPVALRPVDIADTGVARASTTSARGALATAVAERDTSHALAPTEAWQEERSTSSPGAPDRPGAPGEPGKPGKPSRPTAPTPPEIDPPRPPIQEPPGPGRPEIDEPPRAPGPDIPPPTQVPPPPSGVPPMTMTMAHSVAVIVARGADL
jgi:heme A synthase